MVTAAHAQTWLTNGLLAYFPFNGNGNDASGNGNNLALIGQTFIPDVRGTASNAIHFNYNTAITIPNSQSWNHTNCTVALWASLDAVGVAQNRWPMPTGKRVDFSHCTWEFSPQNQNLAIPNAGWIAQMGTASQPILASQASVQTIVPGQWVHLCMTLDGQTMSFYLNGGLVSQTSYVPPLLTAANPITIGGNGWVGPEQTWVGGIDQFRYYNRALSGSEVAQLPYVDAGYLNIRKAVYLDGGNLSVGSSYQLQVSSDLVKWTNHGEVFTATNSYWRSTNYWDVEDWSQVFFRLVPQ